MQTTLFKVETKDGRMFKIFCANRNQSKRFFKAIYNSGHTVKVMEDGIHDIRQFEKFIKTLN